MHFDGLGSFVMRHVWLERHARFLRARLLAVIPLNGRLRARRTVAAVTRGLVPGILRALIRLMPGMISAAAAAAAAAASPIAIRPFARAVRAIAVAVGTFTITGAFLRIRVLRAWRLLRPLRLRLLPFGGAVAGVRPRSAVGMARTLIAVRLMAHRWPRRFLCLRGLR